MKALAVSNFPSHFNESKLRPELAERGVEVEFKTSNELSQLNTPSVYDAILCFFDLMSHPEYDQAKQIAKKSNTRFYLLNRKSASWPKIDIIPRKATPMAPPKSVQETDLVPMLIRYIDLANQNTEPDEVVRQLSAFWTGRPLNTYAQLQTYLGRVRGGQTFKCPKFFADYWDNRDSKTATQPAPVMESVAESNQDPKLPEVPDETKEYIKLLEIENQELRNQIKQQNQKNTPQNVKEAFRAIKTLVDIKLMTPEEAYRKVSMLLM